MAAAELTKEGSKQMDDWLQQEREFKKRQQDAREALRLQGIRDREDERNALLASNARLTEENNRLREALKQIANGQFNGYYDLPAGTSRSIARVALAER